ncbi:hypothetical protein UFOVP669_41 [uncultured Caudovirales phage]|uniref:Uncharacterized protein n=1 Tax=uncultured Caudovirales phage TaxID=2100421 RepID=A0A6J5M2T7_9CAUD|nr:hypothetical protein UFOVP400_32 [uncultured Caudovirales phage]CAB4156063.1 hypothetical protein UFOVP669_41 [uncultured Caudovirales phage]
MPSKPNKSRFLSVRVTPAEYKAFSAKARPYGTASNLLRELIDALIDDRVTVIPNPNRSIYHVPGTKD